MHPGQKLKPGSLVRFQDASGRALMGEVLERHFHGRRTIRLWSEDGAPVSSLVDALGHVPLPPYIHRAGYDRRSRTLPDGVRARARLGGGAHRRPPFHDVADRRPAGAWRRSRRSDAARRLRHLQADHRRARRRPRRRSRVVRDHRRRRRRGLPGPGRKAGASSPSARRRRGRWRMRHGAATAWCAPAPDAPRSSSIPVTTFQVIDGLITNFHLPKSSLLMLVCALAGTAPVLRAYQEAVAATLPFLQLRGCDARDLRILVGAQGSRLRARGSICPAVRLTATSSNEPRAPSPEPRILLYS